MSEKRTKTGQEKKAAYNAEYKKKNYKRVPLDLSIDKYNQIKSASDDLGESVNGFIKKSIDDRLENILRP